MRTSVFVRAQVCSHNSEPVYGHVGLCTCKCVLEHVRDSLYASGCLCAQEGVFACASFYVCILMLIKLYLTHILSQSLSVCHLVDGQPIDEMTKTMQPLQWKRRQNLKEKVTKI